MKEENITWFITICLIIILVFCLFKIYNYEKRQDYRDCLERIEYDGIIIGLINDTNSISGFMLQSNTTRSLINTTCIYGKIKGVK